MTFTKVSPFTKTRNGFYFYRSFFIPFSLNNNQLFSNRFKGPTSRIIHFPRKRHLLSHPCHPFTFVGRRLLILQRAACSLSIGHLGELKTSAVGPHDRSIHTIFIFRFTPCKPRATTQPPSCHFSPVNSRKSINTKNLFASLWCHF